MKLGAVSDMHDNLGYVEVAISYFESEGVDAVARCGDTTAPFSATPFGANFDFHAVRGNNDGEWAFRGVVRSFDTYHGDFTHLTLGGQKIVVYHGTKAGLVDALIDSGTHGFVLHGHSHERVIEHRGATTHINPGGLPIPGADDAFHVVVVDLDTGDVASQSL